MCGKVALGWLFLRALHFFLVNIIPYSYLRLHVVLTRRTDGRSLGTLQNAMLYRRRDCVARPGGRLPMDLINTYFALQINKRQKKVTVE